MSGVLLGTPPEADYDEATRVSVLLSAANRGGTTPLQVFLQVSVVEEPLWTSDEIRLVIVEGQTETYSLSDYVVAGTPMPTLLFGTGILDVPVTAHLQADQLTLTAPADIAVAVEYTLPLIAENSEGAVNKDATLVIDPRIVLGELTRFVQSDYDEIRSLLDLRLTEAELPNAVIAGSTYEQAAFAWVAVETDGFVSPLSEDETLRYKKTSGHLSLCWFNCTSCFQTHFRIGWLCQ